MVKVTQFTLCLKDDSLQPLSCVDKHAQDSSNNGVKALCMTGFLLGL